MADSSASQDFSRRIWLGTALAFIIAVTMALITLVAVRYGQHKNDPAARGRAVYAEQCAACHGAKLEGQPNWRQANAQGRLPAPPLDGTGHAWRHGDAELADFIKFSVLRFAGPGYQTDMPAFDGKISDDDVRSLVAYIKSTWTPNVLAAQSFLNPGFAGMPAKVEGDWRLPADCEEPIRRLPLNP